MKRYIEISELPNFEVKCSDGKEYVLLPFKHLFDIPTAEVVEVKHGEWEKFEIPHMMRCSECGVSDLDIHRTKFDFCPYCGAKMDGGNAE